MNTNSKWCQGLFQSLNDKGRWVVPRSGLIFERRGNKLILVQSLPMEDENFQVLDFMAIKHEFGVAGITVE